MKIIIQILFLCLINNITFSQSGWFNLNSGTNQSLNSISCIDTNIAYIAGDNGRILKTTNGGINWIIQTDNFNNYSSQYTSFAIDQNTVYTAGQGGIAKTTNGGINWNIIFIPSYTVISLFMTDNNSGYACGKNSLFLRTINAGNNWVNMTTPVDGNIVSIFFTNIITGYAVVNGSTNEFILKTTNAGINWINLNISLHVYFKSIYFVNNTSGYACGTYLDSIYQNPVIIKTTNAGTNWVINFVEQPFIYNFECITFSDENTGYAAGHSIIKKTTNGGENWSTNYLTTNIIWNMHFINNNTGYAVGDGGLILKTTNGGEPIGIKPISNVIPDEFVLYQNYPNPFNPTTKIKYDIPAVGQRHSANGGFDVHITIYDILGKEVFSSNKFKKAGSYEFIFDGSNYASGLYIYRIECGSFVDTKKMLLVK